MGPHSERGSAASGRNTAGAVRARVAHSRDARAAEGGGGRAAEVAAATALRSVPNSSGCAAARRCRSGCRSYSRSSSCSSSRSRSRSRRQSQSQSRFRCRCHGPSSSSSYSRRRRRMQPLQPHSSPPPFCRHSRRRRPAVAVWPRALWPTGAVGWGCGGRRRCRKSSSPSAACGVLLACSKLLARRSASRDLPAETLRGRGALRCSMRRSGSSTQLLEQFQASSSKISKLS